jgi:ATP-dependent helicase/nuclease subunit A
MTAADDLHRTRVIQREASDPRSSAWVVANAGSGKTHVLTQRVIRLLLDGADPAAILCLTFTKTAAAEMAGRVFGTLGAWATLPDEELAGAIAELQGVPPSPDEMRGARRLFARALETPGGLKIQTIHAFCERLLHQFPFEANVPGQFQVLDDTAARALIEEARADVLNAAAGAETRLGRAMRYLAETTADQQIGEALDALIDARAKLRRWMDFSVAHEGGGTVDNALADLRRRLGLARHETEDAICRDICAGAGWSCGDCGELAGLLEASGGQTDRSAREALAAIAAAAGTAAEADQRLAFFLSSDKNGWKCRSAPHRFSKAKRAIRSGLQEDFAAESERLLALAGRLNVARAHAATEALLVVGDAILQAYHAAKRLAGMLDFSDLIAKTRNLLSRADASQWVLYKLDRRIEHILVDEAQDTSPDQWAVVQALAEDFFAGAGAARWQRTVFAVGDDKQSIFGFQGAAPHMLAEMQRFFAKRIADAGERLVARPLYLSFRSTDEILHAVDKVFDEARAPLVTASTYTAHASNRPQEPGQVVVMPRIVRQKSEEPEDWTTPFDAPTAAETELAQKIADEILRIRGTTLPSGKHLRDGGILILVRKRDAFAAAMNRALRNKRIPTAGADRIPVATHIAVLDLLALADVMLLPDDDLQLAALLKSPLLGLGEDELMRLAAGERKRSLWAELLAADNLVLSAAAGKLRRWRGMADQTTPFRFFATVLGPDGGRRAFRARLGGEAEDILDTFLSQALAYEALEPPSLQGFVAYIRPNESDIKRETEEGAAGVRVMTVHGAKGLEADVVFLVDTGGLIVVPGQRARLVPLGSRDDPAFFWRRRAEEAPDAQRIADVAEDDATSREYLRLLYVAMTRARDVLYVCGIKGERTPADTWYSVVEGALVPADAERDAETGQLAAPNVWPQPQRAPITVEEREVLPENEPVEDARWLFRSSPTPPPAPEPLLPSRALAEPDPQLVARPGEAAAMDDAALSLRRGLTLHALLQALPDISAPERRSRAEKILARDFADEPATVEALWGEVESVLALEGPFGTNSRAEVAIVGRLFTSRGEYAVSGRIDRLVRTPAGWAIYDFKTERPVPGSVAETDTAYILQLALYRRLLMEMEPGAKVEAALVWTAGPNLMPIPSESMEQALEKLGLRAIAVP